jgi:dTDP-4-dehydrorhamnose reductase
LNVGGTAPHLVVGADGLIGGALVAAFRRAGEGVHGTSRRAGPGAAHLDLAAPESAWRLPPAIGAAFLLAGVTDMARCEADPAGTGRINVDATMTLARRAARAGARIVVVSTNLVLAGDRPHARPDAPLAPQNEYARQKAAVERELLGPGFAGHAAVLRITKLAETLAPLLRTWSATLASKRPIAPFSDLVCAPMPLAAAIAALTAIARMSAPGLFHHGGDEDMSYAEIGALLAGRRRAEASLVRPTTSAEAGVRLAARPEHTTLDDAQSRAALGLAPVRSREALDRLLDQLGVAEAG